MASIVSKFVYFDWGEASVYALSSRETITENWTFRLNWSS